MRKLQPTTDESDGPWKEALQLYFPSFLAFFFPDIHPDIDWSRGYVSLDKEFQQIVRRAKLGKRLADKLFKVWLKDGSDCWILIHVEIQSAVEKEFERRMFEYHLAIRRLYNREVVGLALLCDDQPDWRPTQYAYERWGCRMELTFRIAKLLDWQPRLGELEASENPIATVVAAHLEAKATRNDPRSRKDAKLRLAKGLLKRGWSTDEIRELLRLIDWLMSLPDNLHEEFLTEIHDYEEERTVEYVTSYERSGIKKGLLEGIALHLGVRFGAAGTRLAKEIGAMNLDELRKFARFLKKAATLDEIRDYLK